MRKYDIDKQAHYFALMRPLEGIITPSFSIMYTTNSSREKWVECVIVEERYKIDNGYKLELRSIEPGYGKRDYYIEDFLSALASGYIVKKEPDMQCVEEGWDEPLTDNVHLHHSAYTLKIVKNK